MDQSGRMGGPIQIDVAYRGCAKMGRPALYASSRETPAEWPVNAYFKTENSDKEQNLTISRHTHPEKNNNQRSSRGPQKTFRSFMSLFFYSDEKRQNRSLEPWFLGRRVQTWPFQVD